MSKHAAIYLRVSTSGQEHRSQEPDLRRWAAAAEEPVEWYRDKASGSTMERPDWRRLWAAVQCGAVSRIVVWRIDRLGRTAVELLKLFDELRKRGVDLVSIRDGAAGLDSPNGRLLAGILAHVAEYEREIRAERQTAGIAARKARGESFGRPKGTGRPITVTPERAALIRRLRAEGSTVAAIARNVGVSRDSVYVVLSGDQESSHVARTQSLDHTDSSGN